MTPVEVVQAFWDRMQDRDWEGVKELLVPDAVFVWPASNERFVGAEAIVRVNAEYPEGWSTRLLRLVEQGNTVVAEVEVPQAGVGIFRVVAIAEVTEDQIARSTEYWVTVGGDEPPAWRSGIAERIPEGGLEDALDPDD